MFKTTRLTGHLPIKKLIDPQFSIHAGNPQRGDIFFDPGGFDVGWGEGACPNSRLIGRVAAWFERPL
jgi:hypothetical protein